MSVELTPQPEIESFNLADLDVGALDARLELTMLIPSCTLRICDGNCSVNCDSHCPTRNCVLCTADAA